MKAGTLIVDIALNLERLQKDMQGASRTVETGLRDVQRSARNIRNVVEGALAATGATLLTRQMIDRAREAEQAQNRMQAVLRATGRDAGNTKRQIDELVDALARSTQFDDEGIRNAGSQLLKFGNIHGKIFGDALKASTDLAAFMGTDVPEAAQLLGKALQSPTEGLGMLERQFGQLEPAQERHLKLLAEQGKGLQAQLYVLELVNAKIGGTAAVMNTELTQATTGFSKAWDDMLEGLGRTDIVGGAVIGTLTEIARLMRDIESAAKGPGPLGAFENKLGLVTAEIQSIERSRPATRRSPLIDERLAELRAEQASLQGILGAAKSTEQDPFAFDPSSLKAGTLGGKPGGKQINVQDLLSELSGVDKDFIPELRALHTEYASGAIKLETYRAAVEKLILKQQASKDLIEQSRAVSESQARAMQETTDKLERQGEVMGGAFSALQAYRQEMEFEASILKLSEPERQRLIEFRRIDLQVLELSKDATGEQITQIYAWGEAAKRAYEQTAAAKQALLDQDGRIAGALESQSAMEAQAKRSGDVLEQAVANGIMAGFRRAGPNFAAQFRSTLEDAIATALLTPVISRMAAPFSNVGAWSARLGEGIATSGFGQRMGWSTAVEDASGNVTYQPTQGARNAAANAPGWIGAAIAIAGVMRNSESRASFDDLPASYEAKLGMTGNRRAQFNPFGSWMAGDIGGREAALGMLAPGLIRTKGLTNRTGVIGGGLGSAALLHQNWFDHQTAAGASGMLADISAQEQNLMRNWQLSPEQLARINGSLATRQYDFGREKTPWEQSQAFEQIRADRLNAIAGALGRSIEDLTRIMSLSAEQFAEAQRELENQLEDLTNDFGDWIRNLPDQLGISALEQFRAGLNTAEFHSPLDRLAGAQTNFADTLARARGGELDAVRAFPDAAQQLLSIGRDVYASGPEFQALFREANLALGEVLEKQNELRLDILKDVPQTIMDTSRDEIAEMKRQTETLLEAFNKLTNEVRLLRAA